MERFTLTVDGSGRILLPAKVRKQLKLQEGSRLMVHVNQEQMVLETRSRALRDVQKYFAQFRPKTGKLVSEELIEERGEEARREREE